MEKGVRKMLSFIIVIRNSWAQSDPIMWCPMCQRFHKYNETKFCISTMYSPNALFKLRIIFTVIYSHRNVHRNIKTDVFSTTSNVPARVEFLNLNWLPPSENRVQLLTSKTTKLLSLSKAAFFKIQRLEKKRILR